MEPWKTGENFESESRKSYVLVSQDHEEQTEINAGSPASIASSNAPKQGTRFCEGCILLKNEIEEIKERNRKT